MDPFLSLCNIELPVFSFSFPQLFVSCVCDVLPASQTPLEDSSTFLPRELPSSHCASTHFSFPAAPGFS